MTPSEEVWSPIPMSEGRYEVSNFGRVRSLDRDVVRGSGMARIKGQVLKPISNAKSRYLTVTLNVNRVHHTKAIHRLVAEAFLGACPAGMECRHLDGDASNNRASNLAWGTRTENQADILAHGTHNHASKTQCIRGHEFTEANTYRWWNPKTSGWVRICRTCQRDRQNRRRKRAKQSN